ncbi:uncharacterized protein BO97DRAFT_229359 [Aspergillus homomorphus CBS 101889]|uniref:Uncharacterized protein n=1 Tax=Aspergillus homomorphus (strain CBS 101889) TaxID=1450537 RepID=A0A395HJ76_ASPHC|nr:hypothetical protein BO97DRAFT_229359 [Aspergillus homomorphus CBS 101889]RAL07971.1 hypothetical protein BO97DRAFT_229359 [Aspergillus homomorphus CBS 101889]
MGPQKTARRALSHEEAWDMIRSVGYVRYRHKRNSDKPSKEAVSQRGIEKRKKLNRRLYEIHATCCPNGERAWSLLLKKLEQEKNGPVLNIENAISYEHASLKGIAAVFETDFCDMIRRTSIRIKEQFISGAAVTMTFPRWNESTCTLIIDIAKGANDLAMALFGITCELVGHNRHIMTTDGLSLILPATDITLKGAKQQAIIKVLGSRILEALNDYQQGSSAEEKFESVSMTVRGQDASCEVALNPSRAVQIAKMLYI